MSVQEFPVCFHDFACRACDAPGVDDCSRTSGVISVDGHRVCFHAEFSLLRGHVANTGNFINIADIKD